MKACFTCVAFLLATVAFSQQKNTDKSWPYGPYDKVHPKKTSFPPPSNNAYPLSSNSVRGALVFSNSPPVATNLPVPSSSTNSISNGVPRQKLQLELNDKR
jgi:hypothetical protein